MRLDHVTLQDDSLTHQVRFFTDHSRVFVSCNCRKKPPKGPGGTISYGKMGESTNLDLSRRLYNDPANHNAPFTKEDEAKW